MEKLVSVRWRLLAAVLLLAAGVYACFLYLQRPAEPMEVSFWYWHSPFAVASGEAEDMKSLGVRRLFVRAGTISATGDGAEMVMPQSWQRSPQSPPVHLVFALDAGIVRHFDDFSPDVLARCISSAFLKERAAAANAGVAVEGLQVDFDCPTRLLPRYAETLSALRKRLPVNTQLSITSLPTWFTSRELRRLVRHVDFYCPQFYETRIGSTLDEAHPVSDLRVLENGLEAARRLRKPFYPGVPAYGRGYMFSDRRQLLGTYRAMGVLDAARHPSFAIEGSWPATSAGDTAIKPDDWCGEEMVDFTAVRPGTSGRGLGYHLLYVLPTMRMLARNIEAVRQHRPRNCRGAIIFRYPERDETATLPACSIRAVLQHQEPAVKISARVKASQEPWGIVEGTGGNVDHDISVSLTNTGNSGTSFSKDAVALVLSFDSPGVEAERGDFDRVLHVSQSGQPSSPARASAVICRRFYLGPGETVTVGPVMVTGAQVLRVGWRVKMPGGFRTVSGKIQPVRLEEVPEAR